VVGAGLVGVLAEGDVAYVMTAIFNSPVSASVAGQVGGPGDVFGQVGDAVNVFFVVPAVLGVEPLGAAGDVPDLGGVREVDVVGRCGADLPVFDAAVAPVGVGVEASGVGVVLVGQAEAGRDGGAQLGAGCP